MYIESVCWLYRLNYGGVETRAKNIANYLAKNHHVEMLYAIKWFFKKEGGNLFFEKGLRIYRDPYKHKKYRKRHWEEYFLNKTTNYLRNKSGIALVDGQGINAIPGIDAGIPTIATIHGVDRWIKNPPFLEKRVIEKADILVAITNYVKDKLIAEGADKNKIHVIHNGVDVSKINKVNCMFSEIAEKYRLDNEKKIILSVHNFSEKKNIKRTILAFDYLKSKGEDVQLVIIGDGILRKEMEDFVSANDFHDIIFLGRLPQEEIYKFYKHSRVFVLPSTEGESWGIVFADAMAAGCPILLSNKCGITEILRDKKDALIVDPYTQDEINKALYLLWTDRSLKEELIFNGRRIAEELNWERQGAKFCDLIDTIQ